MRKKGFPPRLLSPEAETRRLKSKLVDNKSHKKRGMGEEERGWGRIFSSAWGEKPGDGERRTILSNKGIEERGRRRRRRAFCEIEAASSPSPLLSGGPSLVFWKTCLHIHGGGRGRKASSFLPRSFWLLQATIINHPCLNGIGEERGRGREEEEGASSPVSPPRYSYTLYCMQIQKESDGGGYGRMGVAAAAAEL